MKIFLHLSTALSIVLLFSLLGCFGPVVSQEIPAAYCGKWKSENCKIKMRTKKGFMKYDFRQKTIHVELEIKPGNQFTLNINGKEVEAVSLKKNKGNPNENGIAWLLQCKVAPQILDENNEEDFIIEFWLLPMKEKGILDAEIRLMDGWDAFPMGDCKFRLSAS